MRFYKGTRLTFCTTNLGVLFDNGFRFGTEIITAVNKGVEE